MREDEGWERHFAENIHDVQEERGNDMKRCLS
jgi:hypothetical protein